MCTQALLSVSDMISLLFVMLSLGCILMHNVEDTLPKDGAEGTISHKKEAPVSENVIIVMATRGGISDRGCLSLENSPLCV